MSSAARRELRKTTRYTRSMVTPNTQQEIYLNTRFKKAYPEFIRHQMFPEDVYVPEKERLAADEWPFMVGDRVQVVKPNKGASDDRGKVSKIVHVDPRANMVFVDGLGGTKRLVVPPQAFSEGQTKPVVDVPRPMPIKNLRLVVTVPAEEGAAEKEKDVAVHSVFVDKDNKYYDQDYNQFLPTRVLEHDRAVEIPWPRPEKLLQPSPTTITTNSGVVGERTFFPSGILTPPVPTAALPQIRNIYSKFNRHKRITAKDILRFTEPVMPVPKAKREYLEKAAERFGADGAKVRPKVLSDEELKKIEDFVGAEIAKGLEKRVVEETQAYAQYQ